ncbi:hypothetical protein OESDEN_24272 [Oesophagostomum dentatum]|uniref:Uncharacterized protein n=1 Tax=Oesophagostomum dentatum TaxID=61180 RepID=A0A0B1RTW9_OESDE|nr:hypothetical protein OESDEN_24272 [Oesophagostomum dentatum]
MEEKGEKIRWAGLSDGRRVSASDEAVLRAHDSGLTSISDEGS